MRPRLVNLAGLAVLLVLLHVSVGEAQVVYENDFENASGSEWSNGHLDKTPTGRGYLGQFGNDVARLSLSSLPSHSALTVSFRLYVLRSWDGNAAGFGPDIWQVAVDDQAPLLRTTFRNTDSGDQSYPGPYPGDHHPGYTAASEKNTLGYTYNGVQRSAVYRMRFTFAHSDAAVRIDFSASGLEALGNESWGLDDVIVMLGDGASPATEVLHFEPTFGGVTAPSNGGAAYLALGQPDDQRVSIGSGGRLEVGFAPDVALTNSGDSKGDVAIFEEGDAAEDSYVALHPADEPTRSALGALCVDNREPLGDGFCEIGRVAGNSGGQRVDLDAVFPGLPAGTLAFDAVQLVDVPDGLGDPRYYGADIDAVLALALRPRSPAGVPSPLGAWSGEVHQLDNDENYDIAISIDALAIQQSAGTIEYPSLGCGGSLTYLGRVEGRYLFREHITAPSDCVDGGLVTIDVTGTETASWEWSRPNGTIAAIATLSRTGTATPTVAQNSSPTPTPTEAQSECVKRPLIFLPGILGSALSAGGRALFPTTDDCRLSLLRLPQTGVPRSPLSASVLQRACSTFCGEEGCSEVYRPFVEFLKGDPQISATHEIFPWGYDWRLNLESVAGTAPLALARFIQQRLDASHCDRVDIVAHSMGGLVAKAYLSMRDTRTGLKENEHKVRRLVFIGTPHFGAPRSIVALTEGVPFAADPFFERSLSKIGVLAYVARNSPATYQLLPSPFYYLSGAGTPLRFRSGSIPLFSLPVDTYDEALRTLEDQSLTWAHRRCLSCPLCALDACQDRPESLNARLSDWAGAHRRWDLWSPTDPAMDAYALFGTVTRPCTTTQVTLAQSLDSSRAWVADQRCGSGDGTVPAASASAQGVEAFLNRRFEFHSEHLELVNDAGVRACVKSLVGDAPDPGVCATAPSDARSAQTATWKVKLDGADADLIASAANGGSVGRLSDGSVVSTLGGGEFSGYSQTQIILAPRGETLTVRASARAEGSWLLQVQPLLDGRPTGDLVYLLTLARGGSAEVSLSSFDPATTASVDSDGDGNVDATTLPTERPVADAGADVVAHQGDFVMLDASNSVSGTGQLLDYVWTQVGGPSVNLSDASSPMASFVAPAVDTDTSLRFALTVKAADGASQQDTTAVLIRHCGIEICNGIDDDCDGQVDENTVEPVECAVAGDVDCKGDLGCDHGTPACLPRAECASTRCQTDEDCDDKTFCNGAEVCIGGVCAHADAPCAEPCELCDEPSGSCTSESGCVPPTACEADPSLDPILQPLAPDYDLGTIDVGVPKTLAIPVANTGCGLLEIETLIDCPGISIEPSAMTLGAGGEGSVIVRVVAAQPGAIQCDVNVMTNVGEFVTSLTANGVSPATATPSPTLLVPTGGVTATATSTSTPTPSSTRTPTTRPCPGDCHAPHEVTVDEVVTMVRIARGMSDPRICPAGDNDGDGLISDDEVITALDSALGGCVSWPLGALRLPLRSSASETATTSLASRRDVQLSVGLAL